MTEDQANKIIDLLERILATVEGEAERRELESHRDGCKCGYCGHG